MSVPAPSLRFERSLFRSGVTKLAAFDEVGRGALAGPVTLGVVVISASTPTAPRGVKDSKLISPAVREALVPKIKRWAEAWGVGHASSVEIDELGMTAALRLAGHRALAQAGVEVDAILLDGKHDYLTPPAQGGLFGDLDGMLDLPPVHTKIKADMTCAAVAAASVLAKTSRDAILVDLAESHPAYGWQINKGYASPLHMEALKQVGLSDYHRKSWTIQGLSVPDGSAVGLTPIESQA